MKIKTMMDCIDLLNNELGLENLGKAMIWTDQNFNNEWSDHINHVEEMIKDPRYVISKDFVHAVSTAHYDQLNLMIKRFKSNSGMIAEIIF